ncbi:hypothetical protein GGQ22_04575 [Nocardioides sp. zg-579]|uniref:DUF4259 domain-containing protein n=1 Tax=Nocardioides marmotae TaxID=2663857 RepID=A0A6I3J013_9ACTN|nr:hypothetical protein [Nocardioides marmotae]MCR6030717.1 hypothetical protein [Gordonia jinghuaiqii]MTB94351.1 hypothetical protein [Nocardioides marmotae]QKE01622.1 hypothetical protein HPC71_11420 [Nocardioides marmotae]
MGSWGVGIHSNDDASDLRDDFRDLIAGGLSAEDATHRLQNEYGVGDRGVDDNDFWLGLAAAQHSSGHINPTVLERAIAIIDSSDELARWAPEMRKRRQVALLKLRQRLEKVPPPPRRIRPRTKADTSLEEGQHVAVNVAERRVLLRVTGVTEDKGGRYPRVTLVSWDGTDRQLRRAHRLPAVLDPTPRRDDEAWGFLLIGDPGDPEDITVLPQRIDRRTPMRRWQSQHVTKWSDLGSTLGLAE